MNPRLVAVIGRQRSGTSVLRQFIGSSSRSCDIGEVFHGLTDRTASFWGFLHARALVNETYRFPPNWILAWQEFIETLSESMAFEVFTFDVKKEYFPIVLRTNGVRADFFFDSPGIAYIHLRRRNTARQVISRYVAAATNVWSQTNPEGDIERLQWHSQIRGTPPPPRPIEGLTIDPAALLREIDVMHEEDEGIENLLGHKFALRLTYEELFDEAGNFTETVAAKISGITGIEETEFQKRPILLKLRQAGVLEGIENAEEIISAFRGTGYEWMLNT